MSYCPAEKGYLGFPDSSGGFGVNCVGFDLTQLQYAPVK